MAISPTAEGFRAAFRQPALALAEIIWRWAAGATATALFFFGLFEYLDSLPVTNGELFFLRTRHPLLVSRAIEHILRGNSGRAVAAAIVAAVLVGIVWIAAASLGRVVTVRSLLEHVRARVHADKARMAEGRDLSHEAEVSGDAQAESRRGKAAVPALIRLNLLRAAVAIAALIGFVGAAVLAGFASPASNPQPGLVFLLFVPLAGLVALVWYGLNWLLSLASMFAVRDGAPALDAIVAAVALCRERAAAVFAVSTWAGLAHLVAFSVATSAAGMAIAFGQVLPWRLVALGVVFITLVYFALVDWLYTARLAGYVCIAELPEELQEPAPSTLPIPSPLSTAIPPASPLQTTIDRSEVILSDKPNVTAQTSVDQDEVILSDKCEREDN